MATFTPHSRTLPVFSTLNAQAGKPSAVTRSAPAQSRLSAPSGMISGGPQLTLRSSRRPHSQKFVTRGWPWDGLFKKDGGEKMLAVEVDEERGVLGEEERYGGEPALLLMGFESEELQPMRAMLHDLGASFVQLSRCTPAMLQMTLQDALNIDPDAAAAAAAADDDDGVVAGASTLKATTFPFNVG
mmetsp:Transcript_21400/g.25774  ORF Transcript_21400/g.25774 Transcript_21400/m.25774 type:complete len:186 (-) Transcript_21400:566-1123(-)